MAHIRLPLTSRPLDLIYFLFFFIHIIGTLLIDIQALYPLAFVPDAIARLPVWYLQKFADPLIAGSFGLNGPPALWVWFKSFLVLEAVFQVPVFIIGLRALWKDSRTLYPLFLIYSASSATTTLPCLATILRTPVSSTPIPASFLDPRNTGIANGMGMELTLTLTPEQRMTHIASYLAFLVIQMMMCVDMAVRVAGLVTAGERALERKEKREGGKGE